MKGMPSRPSGIKGLGKGSFKSQNTTTVKPGYGTKHQLRKGTMFPGMDTEETGVADQMTDYARMAAAGGM